MFVSLQAGMVSLNMQSATGKTCWVKKSGRGIAAFMECEKILNGLVTGNNL
jgi:hypothetical protein